MATASERRPGVGDTPADDTALGTELGRAQARIRELEEQLREARRLESLGRLAGGVAHDLNNVMAVISGFTEIMLRRIGPTDPLRANAESIRKAAAWGVNLARSVLASGRAAAQVQPAVDLNVVVANVVRALGPLLGDHVRVELRPGRALGGVSVSPGQLEQIIMNLILNARDAMEHGGRLGVETANTVLDGRPAVRLKIGDTGCGMDEATLSRAFEPYFTTKPAGKGTGLGLATVFGIVAQHGGRVDAASTVGEGSTFTVDLPRVAEPGSGAPPPGSETQATVLVLESEAGVRELIGEILEIHAYRVLSASGFDDALAVAAAHPGPVHLVIADVMVPGVRDGRLLERLLATRPGIRVLYASGELEDSLEEFARDRGPRVFLHKPFTVDAL
ncbi:MAG: hybrid sensor histidine kinase/response regulator, partial [Candidatus Rokuibacteriota bacterium]